MNDKPSFHTYTNEHLEGVDPDSQQNHFPSLTSATTAFQPGAARRKLSKLPDTNRSGARFLEKALRVVEANLEDSTFTTDDFARQMLLSRTHLFRKLKAVTGSSASTFIRHIRLERAAQLLQADSDPVSQIAFQVGFNHLSYFAKCFKEKYGCSPSVYKKDKY